MKIIEPGREQKGWALKTTCSGMGNGNGGCGAVLLVEEADVYATYNYDYTGSRDKFATFMCPSCSVETDIPHREIPTRVWNALVDKKAWLTINML